MKMWFLQSHENEILTSFLKKTLNLLGGGWDRGVIVGLSPLFKKHSLSEFIKSNETFNFCDIWSVNNPHKKLFTFQQKHFSDIIHRRLDYIFLSNSLQESVKKTEIVNALSSDHSPVFCSFFNNDTFVLVSDVWKFNNFLLFNTYFVKNWNLILKL